MNHFPFLLFFLFWNTLTQTVLWTWPVQCPVYVSCRGCPLAEWANCNRNMIRKGRLRCLWENLPRYHKLKLCLKFPNTGALRFYNQVQTQGIETSYLLENLSLDQRKQLKMLTANEFKKNLSFLEWDTTWVLSKFFRSSVNLSSGLKINSSFHQVVQLES